MYKISRLSPPLRIKYNTESRRKRLHNGIYRFEFQHGACSIENTQQLEK